MEIHTEKPAAPLDGRPLFWVISALVVSFLMFSLGAAPLSQVSCAPGDEDLFGEITVVREPVRHVIIEEDLIPVGAAHTYSYRLERGHRYHIYLSGDWADPEEHATDYDLYLYEIEGGTSDLLSTHTEAAGLIEQVGNDPWGRYFTPSESGLYYITVRNDDLESHASERGTLMVVERIEANQWHERWMEGKIGEEPQRTTFWTYEFVTSSPHIKVNVDVPDPLDMYEARLYVMGNPSEGMGALVRGAPVAWEPGLQGELQGFYGGFNLDQKGFRHVDAMDSCEYNGEDMTVDYWAPTEGELLYHLVLIAEYGVGKLDFIVQTDFDPPNITIMDPPDIVEADRSTELEIRVTDQTEITDLTMRYTTGDAWTNLTLNPTLDGYQSVTLPGVSPGTTVEYVFEYEDEMGNSGTLEGSYYVMGGSTLDLDLNESDIKSGETAVIRGRLHPEGEEVDLYITKGEEVTNESLTTDEGGSFNHTFIPDSTGIWQLKAAYNGSEAYHPTETETMNLSVTSRTTTITCNLDKNPIEAGGSLDIKGAITPGRAGMNVEILILTGEEPERIYTESQTDGSYSHSYQPPSKGIYTVKAKVVGDGFLYKDSESGGTELRVINPRLTTKIARLPSMIAVKIAPFLRPPYLYGLVGLVGIGGGGLAIYLRRRE